MKSTFTKAVIGSLGAGIVTLCVAASAWTMSSEDGSHHDPARILEHMSKKLDLSEEQSSAVEGLLTSSSEQAKTDQKRLHTLKNDLHAQRAAFDAGTAQMSADEIGLIAGRMAFRRASTQAQVYQLLNDEQRIELDKMIEKREGRRQGRRHHGKGNHG